MTTGTATYTSDGVITDEALAALRSRIGMEVAGRPQPYLTEATRDAIRHWAEAIGDRNPFWTDEAYAKTTRWGGLIAPPTMLAAFDKLSSGYRGGLPGVHSFFGGIDWTWAAPVRLNDKISVSIVFSDLVEKAGRFSGRMFQQISDVTFTNQEGTAVCSGKSWGMRTERAEGRSHRKHSALELKHYTDKDLADIYSAYENEFTRGSAQFYWQDVIVGEPLPSLPKGPYTPTQAVAFEMARGGLYIKTHGFWYDYLKQHPALGIANELGLPEPPERVHWDSELARRVGVPAAYDYGHERIAWLGQLITNWAGDEAFLRRLQVRIKRFNLLGDMTWCRGIVTDKREVGGVSVVDCEIWCEDQRGQRTAEGIATVEVPKRADH